LGLLAYLLDDLTQGRARIGYGTRRGLGRVQVSVQALRWRFPARIPELRDDRLVLHPLTEQDIRPVAEGDTSSRYGLLDTGAPVTVGPVAADGGGPLQAWTLAASQKGFAEELEALWGAVAPRWWVAVEQWSAREVAHG
jgi:hypothetical protein